MAGKKDQIKQMKKGVIIRPGESSLLAPNVKPITEAPSPDDESGDTEIGAALDSDIRRLSNGGAAPPSLVGHDDAPWTRDDPFSAPSFTTPRRTTDAGRVLADAVYDCSANAGPLHAAKYGT